MQNVKCKIKALTKKKKKQKKKTQVGYVLYNENRSRPRSDDDTIGLHSSPHQTHPFSTTDSQLVDIQTTEFQTTTHRARLEMDVVDGDDLRQLFNKVALLDDVDSPSDHRVLDGKKEGLHYQSSNHVLI